MGLEILLVDNVSTVDGTKMVHGETNELVRCITGELVSCEDKLLFVQVVINYLRISKISINSLDIYSKSINFSDFFFLTLPNISS